jgi:hypothetical protein
MRERERERERQRKYLQSLIGKTERKRTLERIRHRCDNVKIYFK